MEPTRFDALTRALAGLSGHLPTRRALLAALGASALRFTAEPALETEAKKRRKRRRKKKKCLFGQRKCRDRRCHGCCSDADCGGNVCELGTCSDCPRNERVCRGGCIPEDACCVDTDCRGGRVCIDGACDCGPNHRLCNGVCIRQDECCGDDCPNEPCTAATCNGCCDGNTCRNGDSANFCGRNGIACAQCASGETCDAGVCRGGGGACSPETCNGCCDGSTCREGEGQNFCGRGGVACASCGRDAFCNAGQCDCPSGTEMCPNGDCVGPDACCGDADCPACQLCTANHQCIEACPGGCCHDGAICEPGTTNAFCGTTGGVCETCDPEMTCLEVTTGNFQCFCSLQTPVACPGTCCTALGMVCCPASSHLACCEDPQSCFLPGVPFRCRARAQ